jgi:hypothetical protein
LMSDDCDMRCSKESDHGEGSAEIAGATVRRFPATVDDRRRFFILSAGRTGSSLLSAILGECGADFAMQVPTEWDPGSGALEHVELNAATSLLRRAHEIDSDKPPSGYRRYVWSRLRSRAKRKLSSVLGEARYLKGENLDLAVQPAFKLGYFPSVILSYRRFEDLAVSSFIKRGASTFESLLAYYQRINRNGLLLMSIFGGCAIGYEQLVDPQDVSWVEPLSSVTGIAASRLTSARDRRLGSRSRSVEAQCLDGGAREVFEAIDALRGRELMSSDQVARSVRQKLRANGVSQLETSNLPDLPRV